MYVCVYILIFYIFIYFTRLTLYKVVTLQKSDELTVIPATWLNEERTQCYWPPFKSPENCTEAVKYRLDPPVTIKKPWELLNIQVHTDCGNHLYFYQIQLHFFMIYISQLSIVSYSNYCVAVMFNPSVVLIFDSHSCSLRQKYISLCTRTRGTAYSVRDANFIIRIVRAYCTCRSHMRIKFSCSIWFIRKVETVPWGYRFTSLPKKNCLCSRIYGFTHLRNKHRHCPASQMVACSNTWSRLAFPLCLLDFYEFFFRVLRHTVIFITAPYAPR